MDELFLVGRLIFGGFFLYNGVNHFLATASMTQYAAAKGVPLPEVAVIVGGLLLLCGGLSIVLGFLPHVGLACIVVFLAGVTPAIHNFWASPAGVERTSDLVNFTKNVGLLGGTLALFGVPRPWPYSIQRRARMIA
jgi:putative oxidoreductase